MMRGTRRRPARTVRALAAAIAALVMSGCIDTFLAPEPADDVRTIYDLVWTEFDRHYSFFEAKQVDWDAAYERHGMLLRPNSPRLELFGALTGLLGELKDGHVNVWSPVGHYGYTGWYEGRPQNFDSDVAFAHITGAVSWTASRRIAWGRLTNDIGYVHIPGFGGGGWGSEIDDALSGLDGVRALVIDVRSNGGGTDIESEAILARFFDRERTYRYYRYRNGPEHDDFTDLIEDRITPDGRRFDGPIAVLTNRRTYSTAEDFVLGLKVLDRVITVGDTTGGGSGNPTHRELPNGWTYSISRWQLFTHDRRPVIDGVGLAPDIPVSISPADAADGRDTIIVEAIRALEDVIG